MGPTCGSWRGSWLVMNGAWFSDYSFCTNSEAARPFQLQYIEDPPYHVPLSAAEIIGPYTQCSSVSSTFHAAFMASSTRAVCILTDTSSYTLWRLRQRHATQLRSDGCGVRYGLQPSGSVESIVGSMSRQCRSSLTTPWPNVLFFVYMMVQEPVQVIS